MNDLYLLDGSTVKYVGPMFGVEAIDDYSTFPTVLSIFTPYPSPEHAKLNAALTSGEEIAFCWGQEDGTAAPTASGNDDKFKFTCPSTRTYFRFFATVKGIGQRITDTGAQTHLQLDTRTGYGIPMSIKA